MANNIFKIQGDHILLNIPYCEFYIPLYLFTDGYINEYSDRINVLGVFNVGIFESGKFKEMKTLNLPCYIDVYTYESEVRDVQLSGGEVVKCRIYKYFKDNIVMNSYIVEDSENAMSYLNMILGSKIPKIIPYNRSLSVWRKNMDLSKSSFGVSSTVLELILAVVHRNKEKPEQKFSKVIGKGECGQWDYLLASIREICRYTSTFTAITFEDFDTMLTASFNKSREGIEEGESPVEKVIKM